MPNESLLINILQFDLTKKLILIFSLHCVCNKFFFLIIVLNYVTPMISMKNKIM